MRIVYLYQYFTTPEIGGGTRAYEFARRWVAAGHEVFVLCLDPEPRPAEAPQGWRRTIVEGINVVSIPVHYSNSLSPKDRLKVFGEYAVSAAQLARRLHPDVIYATSTPLTIAIPAIAATAGTGTPYVFEVRDVWPDVPIAMGYLENPMLREAAKQLERAAYARASHVVALAPGMKADIVAKGVPDAKVSVIPQGCDVGLFVGADGARVRERYAWLADRQLVLYAGTMGEANDLGYLVELAAAMQQIDPEMRFAIIGEGKQRQMLEQKAAELGVLDVNLFFLGRKPKTEVVDWIDASTLTLALLSGPREIWKDAVQNKFFDSMAGDTPIACNNTGWQTTIAEDAGMGFLISPDSPADAARTIAERLSDADWLAAVPQNCARIREVDFNRDLQAAEALAVLETAVAQAGVKASS